MNSFRMPAEWEPHEGTWMIWPCREEIWGDQIGAAKNSFQQVLTSIARFEPVYLIVGPDQQEEVQQRFEQYENVTIVLLPVDDSWARDTLPMFMVSENQELKALNWAFNCWGEKFFPYDQDKMLSERVSDYLANSGKLAAKESFNMVLEGGSVHFDGEGTLLTTKQCLLHTNRNPELSQSDIEEQLKAAFNVEKVIWLEEGVWGDEDTDGHVDVIAAFAGPGKIITMSSEDTSHPNFDIYARNRAVLEAEVDAKGRSFEIIEVPQPMTLLWEDKPLPLSYINFYLVNKGLILPVFDDPHDERAIQILSEAFPDREIVPVDALPIFRGGGGIHCITMQQPQTKVPS